jgi:hypothetical protein
MWIKTHRTDEIRQALEAEFCQYLTVEQRFPGHPIDGPQFRVYRTSGNYEPKFGSNYLELRASIISRA